jgi:hypothetical protein
MHYTILNVREVWLIRAHFEKVWYQRRSDMEININCINASNGSSAFVFKSGFFIFFLIVYTFKKRKKRQSGRN